MKVSAKKLEGKVTLPSSKSLSHRALICAALASGESRISNLNLCDDILRTIEGLRVLGAKIRFEDEVCIVKGITKFDSGVIDCYESGSTLRFLTPLSLLSNHVTLTGEPSLMKRPMTVYLELFENLKFDDSYHVHGGIKSGHYKVKGNISSQFISGLLFVLPLLEGDSIIEIEDKFESKSYVDLTVEVLSLFGVDIIFANDKYLVKGNQQYQAFNYQVEVDYSALAFFEVANAIGNDVIITNEIKPSKQGDQIIIDVVKNKETIIDVSNCPDLVPALAVYASLMNKRTEIINAKRLRIKESDRLKAITTSLNSIGAKITEKEDALIIEQVSGFKGNIDVSAFNDHRIAMALAIAASRCEGYIEIDDIAVVKKSYEKFWRDFQMLGGEVNE